jgi:hypothetical protein
MKARLALFVWASIAVADFALAAKNDAGAPHKGARAAASASASAAASASASASSAAEPPPTPSCVEHVPPGATKPVVKDQFPTRVMSGYASALEVTVEHGKGETVLPLGFQVQSSGAAVHALAEAGFVLPDPDGGAGPTLVTTPNAEGAVTKLAIPVLVLPKTPGRNHMVLPPMPIAIARASGELLTLCTQPHRITAEDPTSSTPNATPHPNPAPRGQLEEWTLAKQLVTGAAIGAAVAAVLAVLVMFWMRRPRPAPPPPPPRPPWEVAFEELFAVRYAGLAKEGRFAEHYDRVSDAVRKYLGGRYGFDGLETTTREMTAMLRRIEPPVVELATILEFLDESDLVKFARFTPSDEDCTRILDRGEYIVRVTIPPQVATPPAPARVPVAAGGAT